MTYHGVDFATIEREDIYRPALLQATTAVTRQQLLNPNRCTMHGFVADDALNTVTTLERAMVAEAETVLYHPDHVCLLRYNMKFLLPQVVTLEGELEEEVAAASEALQKSLPKEFVVKVVADNSLKDV